ncbi:hypothetical protein [Nocardia cyriacigeorgica]|uniref:hypothetical protein n=1 Tax=Nocardia cyriacigeorgica TaxID=135487 RepID=UPI001E402CC2|nr:hypothetical protein [Nocardia cyriacigeorgica]
MRDAATTTSGAWRIDDGTGVMFRDATVAWALAAHEVLAETATGYGHFVTVKELAERVQTMAGVRTDAPTRTWIDAILRKVARRCHTAGEPPLTALCVKQNLKVSDSYKYVLELADLPIPADIESHAAYARWACYAAYGADVPADGGIPPLVPRGGTARRSGSSSTRTAAAKPDPDSRTVVCSSCFIQLPATGICEHC